MNKLIEFANATNNELYVDGSKNWKGEIDPWMVEAVETQETLADWELSAKNWAERTTMKSGTIAGFPFRSWSQAQVRKGQPRQSMSVVDFGEFRIALPGTDLTYFV